MSVIEAAAKTSESAGGERFGYIDAVRGYAVLMVIVTHCGGRFAELPYPIKKLTNFGWFGVQLFFLASAVTLILSWRRDDRPFGRRTLAFLVRRFFRIAPLYYLAAVVYALIGGAANELATIKAAASFLFVNAWRPDWIPTTPGRAIVPGGWSVGVEFTFYLLLPLIAALAATLRRALFALLAAYLCGLAANYALESHWTLLHGARAAQNFLYFWFPNQAFVFLLGVVLHQLLYGAESARLGGLLRQPTTALALMAVVAIVDLCASQYPSPDAFLSPRALIPTLAIVALTHAVFIAILRFGALDWLSHSWIRTVGRWSFSAYVVHWGVIDLFASWVDVGATGVAAIGQCALLLCLVAPTSLAIAGLLKRLVEDPMIRLGRTLSLRL